MCSNDSSGSHGLDDILCFVVWMLVSPACKQMSSLRKKDACLEVTNPASTVHVLLLAEALRTYHLTGGCKIIIVELLLYLD